MTDYQVKLTPESITPLSEGSLDSSVYNGNSQQRSFYHEIVNESDRKVVELHDGEHFNDIVEPFAANLEDITRKPLHVVDNSEDGLPKRVVIVIKNTSVSFGAVVHYWQDFILNNGESFDFTFSGTPKIATRIGITTLPVINASFGKKYAVNEYNTELVVAGTESSSTFTINNNKTVNMTYAVSKNNHILESGAIAPDDSISFSYNNTFFIGATTDLDTLPEISDLNTQISLLGVAGADISIEATGDVFSFTLENIAYA